MDTLRQFPLIEGISLIQSFPYMDTLISLCFSTNTFAVIPCPSKLKVHKILRIISCTVGSEQQNYDNQCKIHHISGCYILIDFTCKIFFRNKQSATSSTAVQTRTISSAYIGRENEVLKSTINPCFTVPNIACRMCSASCSEFARKISMRCRSDQR